MGHRRSRRNRRSMKPNRRRLRRNIFGTDIMSGVVVPVLGGTAGFIAVRALGNFWANMPNFPLVAGNPRASKLAAAVVGIPLAYWASKKMPMVRDNSGAIVLGMGLAATEGYLRGTPWLTGSPASLLADLRAQHAVASAGGAAPAPSAPTAAAPAAAPATSGFGQYYTPGMLGLGYGVDVSHYGAPYQGMLGLGDDLDQSVAPTQDGATGVSTVTPTDVASAMSNQPQARRVRERMVSPEDRGYAGGMFARHLFAGMAGG